MAGGGQTSYQLNPDIAVPGMLADENLDSRVMSVPAGENIPFGRLCEVDSSGNLFLVKGSGATIASGKLAGVSIFDVAREQQLASTGGSAGSGFYAQSELVPVMRKGRIYAAFDGSVTNVQAPFAAPGVNHPSSSDASGIRGVFSGGTTTTTAGAEITTTGTNILYVRDVSTLTPARGAAGTNNYQYVALLEINLPGT